MWNSRILKAFVTDVVYAVVLAAYRECYAKEDIQMAVKEALVQADLDFTSEEMKLRETVRGQTY